MLELLIQNVAQHQTPSYCVPRTIWEMTREQGPVNDLVSSTRTPIASFPFRWSYHSYVFVCIFPEACDGTLNELGNIEEFRVRSRALVDLPQTSDQDSWRKHWKKSITMNMNI